MKTTNVVNYAKQNLGKIFLGVIGIILIVLLALNMLNSRLSREQAFSAAPPELVIANPGMATPAPIGTTTFCFQLDGRQDGHLPALMGAAAQNVYRTVFPVITGLYLRPQLELNPMEFCLMAPFLRRNLSSIIMEWPARLA